MKKTVLAAGIAGLVAASLVGCGKSGTTSGNGDVNGNITVISREEGSGTRGAFVEITGVEQKNADGKKEDMTTTSAVISNSTNEVSREVKDSEKEKGLVPVVIAKDGIAIVVNKNNTVNEITSEQIKNIYTGSVTGWSEVK